MRVEVVGEGEAGQPAVDGGEDVGLGIGLGVAGVLRVQVLVEEGHR